MKEFEKEHIEQFLGEDFVQGYLFEDEENSSQKRCTKIQKETRKKTIRKLLINGISRKSIIEYCSSVFGVREKQILKYLAEINEEFKTLGKKDAELNYAIQKERLETALSDCILYFDMQSRIRVLRELNSIQGLNKSNMDVTSDGEKIILNISNDFIPDTDNGNKS